MYIVTQKTKNLKISMLKNLISDKHFKQNYAKARTGQTLIITHH